jgi:hypothetical protein
VSGEAGPTRLKVFTVGVGSVVRTGRKTKSSSSGRLGPASGGRVTVVAARILRFGGDAGYVRGEGARRNQAGAAACAGVSEGCTSENGVGTERNGLRWCETTRFSVVT